MGKLVNHTSMTVDGLCDVVTGRKCYDGFLGFWPSATGPCAEVLNPMPLRSVAPARGRSRGRRCP